MKSYFDDDDAIADEDSPPNDLDGPDFLMYSRSGPVDKNELWASIPEKTICDRLVMRYFTSSSPSQRKCSLVLDAIKDELTANFVQLSFISLHSTKR